VNEGLWEWTKDVMIGHQQDDEEEELPGILIPSRLQLLVHRSSFVQNSDVGLVGP
jgi:hypothetical protein